MRFYGSVILWREQTTTTGESELRIGAAEKQHKSGAAAHRRRPVKPPVCTGGAPYYDSLSHGRPVKDRVRKAAALAMRQSAPQERSRMFPEH
mgnify:CR=1 FL=1